MKSPHAREPNPTNTTCCTLLDHEFSLSSFSRSRHPTGRVVGLARWLRSEHGFNILISINSSYAS